MFFFIIGESMEKRFVRLKKNRIFFGVFGGIVEYLEVDLIIVRFIFVVFFVVNLGVMMLVYLFVVLVMFEESFEEESFDFGKKFEDVIKEVGESLGVVVYEDSIFRIVVFVLIFFGVIFLVDFVFRVFFVVGFKMFFVVVLLVIGVVFFKEGEWYEDVWIYFYFFWIIVFFEGVLVGSIWVVEGLCVLYKECFLGCDFVGFWFVYVY